MSGAHREFRANCPEMIFCPQTLTSSLIVVVAIQLQVEMADSLGACVSQPQSCALRQRSRKTLADGRGRYPKASAKSWNSVVTLSLRAWHWATFQCHCKGQYAAQRRQLSPLLQNSLSNETVTPTQYIATSFCPTFIHKLLNPVRCCMRQNPVYDF